MTRRVLAVLPVLVLACHSGASPMASDGDAGTAGDEASGSAGSSGADASSGSENADESEGSTGEPPPPDTDLPPLPELAHVKVRMVGDAANISFDPWDGAQDYRVYPLPPDDAIDVHEDGSVVITDAIYRCAGDREGLYFLQDIVSPEDGWNDNAAGGVTILHHAVEGYMRNDDDAQLGFVYTVEGDGRVPVFVLGDPDPAGEGGPDCGRPAFASGRPKLYTTDESVRDEKIAAGWRDDGIAFYVPAAASDTTRPIYEATFGDNIALRWVDGPEADMRGAGTTIFDVLTAADGAETVPLYRIHVAPYCSRSHDELVAGEARFEKVRSEGDHTITEVRWSGITEDTVLVVEALDHGCPYGGIFSPEHQDAFVEMFGDEVLEYEAWLTLEDMKAASPTGEVFLNGQDDEQVIPKAVARSFVHASPEPATFDFYNTFAEGDDFRGTFGEPTGNEYSLHFSSPDYEVSSYAISNIHFGTVLGELWVAYNDIAADVNGKFRLTPNQRGEITADSFLHVSMEVDIVSTDRRYPQIFISDQGAPVQDNLPMGTTMVIQPKDLTPTHLQVQICDHRTWDVNDQCPRIAVFPEGDLPPISLPGEHAGTDNAITIDAYVSSTRVYLMMNGEQYACLDLPATSFEDGAMYSPPTGSVSVTYGDVLYHSGVDFGSGGGAITGNSYLFHRTHMQKTTRRHFDNIGFASGVDAPPWDETLHPCAGG